MRATLFLATLLACSLSLAQNLPAPAAEVAPLLEGPDQIVPDAIVVVFDEPTTNVLETVGALTPLAEGELAFTGLGELDELAVQYRVNGLRKQFPGADPVEARELGLPDLSGFYVVSFDADRATVDEVLAAYGNAPGVLWAEEIGIHPVYVTPNDPNFSYQWHLNQSSDKDIDAPEAWNVETGDPGIIVAVPDTGVRYFHKDLGGSGASYSVPTGANGNIWINTEEKGGVAGKDDDANGYKDDWVGWDFVTGVSGCWSGEDCSAADNDPRDFNGHGTHCAGNVGAINNNGYAVSSASGGWGNGTLQPTASGVKVMCLRIGWAAKYGGTQVGYVRMDFAASAFYYAAKNGAKIISCSWGSSNSGGLSSAITYFVGKGGLVFKAAGNSGTQSADYMCGRGDVIAVAATDKFDKKASFSNYGTWVDLSAPGVSIHSTFHKYSNPSADYTASLSGTSMATPLAASVAASVWSKNPTWIAAQVWARVRDTADNIYPLNPAYVGKLGSGRVNLYNAVK